MQIINKKRVLGQFFTTNEKVQQQMLSLLSHTQGKALEPSAGSGHLVKCLKTYTKLDVEAWEIDTNITPPYYNELFNYGDFFLLSQDKENSYDVIFGNPPYVSFKEAYDYSKKNADFVAKHFSQKCNLYYLFFYRCIELLKNKGELVFIIPKEWLYTTSASPLRDKIQQTGALTHLIIIDEEKVFSDADVPALIIVRFVKGQKQKQVKVKNWHEASYTDKNISFNKSICLSSSFLDNYVRLGDFIDVKVGLVSGVDKVFDVSNHPFLSKFQQEDTVVSLLTTKGTKSYLWLERFSNFDNIPYNTKAYLCHHKDLLLGRKIKDFNENNFWSYGAIRNLKYMLSSRPRFYCIARSRKTTPFFASNTKMFSGGVLGLFLKDNTYSLDTWVNFLNSQQMREVYRENNLFTGNKLCFTQNSLTNLLIPNEYFDLLN